MKPGSRSSPAEKTGKQLFHIDAKKLGRLTEVDDDVFIPRDRESSGERASKEHVRFISGLGGGLGIERVRSCFNFLKRVEEHVCFTEKRIISVKSGLQEDAKGLRQRVQAPVVRLRKHTEKSSAAERRRLQ